MKTFNFVLFFILVIFIVMTITVVIRTTGGNGRKQPCTVTISSNEDPTNTKRTVKLENVILDKFDAMFDDTSGGIYPGSDVLSREIAPLENVSSHTVYYFWCKKELFTYENYLSVLSVVKNIKPMKIKLYYTTFPGVDSFEYFTWFKDILTIPYFVVEKLDDNHKCQESAVLKLQTVVDHLKQHGGLYVGEETIVRDIPVTLLHQSQIALIPDQNYTFQMASNATHSRVFIKFLNGVIGIQSNHTKNTDVKSEWNDMRGCCVIVDLAEYPQSCLCIIPLLDRVLYPKYFFELDNNLGRLFRYIAYGTEDILKPKQNFTELSPRLSHYIWYGKRKFDFSHYLSVLSAIYIAGMPKVFFHGTFEPYGEYWEKVTSEEDVTFIHTDLPESVFRSKVREPAHANDIVKMYILYEYGGVHQDPDVYWLNYISDDELAYDSMMGFEWLQAGLWPETFNIGVFLAKKRSRFIREFIKTLKDFRDDRWIFNSALMTYRTYERLPDVLFADRHLQVLCYLHRCHPPWLNDYNIYDLSPRAPGFDFDWKNEALTIHNTIPKPYEELSSMQKLHNSSSMFANIGRFILEKASRNLHMEHFENQIHGPRYRT